MPTTAAISRARVKLGAAPLKALFEQVAKPLAAPTTRGSWYRSWRVLAVDGTTFDVHVTAPGQLPPADTLLKDLDGTTPEGFRVVVLGTRGRSIDVGTIGRR